MHSYHAFFIGSLFFLIGVLLASTKQAIIGLFIVFAFILYSLVYWLLSRYGVVRRDFKSRFFIMLISLSLLLLVGSLYYTWHDMQYRNAEIPSVEESVFSVIITSNPELRGATREAIATLDPPYNGKLLITFQRYPRVYYGDKLLLTGKIQGIDNLSSGRFGVLGVHGAVRFPESVLISQHQASTLRSWLFGIKEGAIETFKKVFPPREAALVSGLTFGERGGFTKEFTENMKASGTTHLVALSGYNITILAWVVMSVLLSVVSRRWAFYGSMLAITAFVVMTGAEASVVRAALMGILVLFAREVGKQYDMRNAIMLTALVMVIQNPKTLSFDVGFQLSFFALLGIVYLRPALINIFHASDVRGLLSWKENMFTTIAAQLAVLPLLLAYFGSISIIAIVANIIILGVVPLTMGFGFLAALFGAFSNFTGILFGIFTLPFARFITYMIEWFGSMSLAFSIPFHIVWALVYYCCIVGFIIYAKRTYRNI